MLKKKAGTQSFGAHFLAICGFRLLVLRGGSRFVRVSSLTVTFSMDGLASEVRQELQSYFEKPKLSDKLLSKPPFRFLHDIVGGLHNATGFADEVFQGDEWDSRAMNATKETKASFMDRLISYVTDMTGEVVEADRNKILAGKEPEQTAKMLLVCCR